MATEKKLIVIAGPTASGKTALSVALAKRLKSVVFSADSRQFYREMHIGTARPSEEEMEGVPHFFIGSHSIENELSSARYAQEAEPLLLQQFETHDTIILTGGSGMFIDALCFGLDDIPHSPELREELNEEVSKNGLSALLQEIKEKDPDYYEQMDRQNPVRVIRAVEVLRLTHKKYSELRKRSVKNHPFHIHYFVIDHPREQLYSRINRRVELMLEQGLEEEARSLLPYRQLQTLHTVGYTEWFDHFDGKIDRPTAISLIQQHSRHYAKRQLTWFRRNPDAIWIPYSETEKMAEIILAQCARI